MYENFKLCADLKPREWCLVLEQYRDGLFTREFHRHIPRHRMSQKDMIELLKAFVVRFDGFTGMGPDSIVASYMNTRGKTPPAQNPFQIHVTYPEPGVVRRYCGTNTLAWMDEVISPSEFRQEVVGG